MFFWILEVLREQGLVEARPVGAGDATTLGGQRGDAFDRAARYGVELRGIFAGLGQGIGNSPTPTREDLARSGSHAEEQGQQRRLGESA